MRLLIATHHVSLIGGAETYLRALLPLLAARGMELALLSESAGTLPGVMEACPGVDYWIAAGRSFREVAKQIEHWKPDLVYCQGLTDTSLERTLSERIPTVLYAHTYSGTCVSGTKCHTRPELEPCQRTLGLGCLAAYLPRGCGGSNPITMLRLYHTERQRSRLQLQYRAILVASRHMAEEYRRHGVPDERLKLVPLFPPDVVPDGEPPAPKPRTDRVLFVGRATALKGLLLLIEAMPLAAKRLQRQLTLVVAGEGPIRELAEIKARDEGVAVEFLGWVPSDKRQALMRAADILAVPSVWPEPFGLVGIEAGCVGLPAVAFAVGGIPDWLIPGVSGELAPGEKPRPAELAEALVRALADDAHRQKLAQGAWQMAQQFTPEAHINRLLPILEAAAR